MSCEANKHQLENGPHRGEDSQQEEQLAALLATEVPEGWEIMPVDPNDRNIAWRQYRYRGTVVSGIGLLSGCMEHWASFRGRPSDVVVASFPKSGTTWLQELVWRVVHRETGLESGGGTPLEERFPLLDMPATSKLRMTPLHELADPRLMKTHLPYHILPEGVLPSGAKILYVSRDPRDVCVSYYHMARLIQYQMYRGTFAELRERFIADRILYGPYREHVKGYLEHSDTVLCLTYEQLHQDRAAVVRKVADFLDVSLTDKQVEGIVANTSFGAMKVNPSTDFHQWKENGFITEGEFFRKGMIGDWKNYFTQEESDSFMKWINEPV